MKFNFIRDAWQLAKPYWTSTEKSKAILLLILMLAFSLTEVYLAVRFNQWTVGFYDAIQRFDKAHFWQALLLFLILAFFYILVFVINTYVSSLLDINWRKWLTNYYINVWLDSKTYYKSRFITKYSDNPDQRISEDIRQYVQLTHGLFLGLFKSLITLSSFVIILWGLSGSFSFILLQHKFSIPGYMVWLAILYAFAGTYLMFKIGKPLTKLNYQQQQYEADFRYNLVRIREYAEPIVSYQGDEIEKKIATKDFANIVTNFMQTLQCNIKIGLFESFYHQISNIVPILVASGRYFAKAITFGNLMQISSAFVSVQGAISYFIASYTTIADLRAVMNRLLEFQQTIADVDSLPNSPIIAHHDNHLTIKNLQLNLPNEQILVNHLSITLHAGERLLIQGPAGAGKSTLLKALNNLWPYVSGEIHKNPRTTTLFVTQKPYLPRTNLKEAICYPKHVNLPSDIDMIQILTQCGLDNLTGQLYEIKNWHNYLSLGEQQKIAFARIIINQPDILFLDECSSALDEAAEHDLYNMIINLLPRAIIISVGHRMTLLALHTRTINIADYQLK